VNEDERYGYLVCEINNLDLDYVLLMLKHAAVASSLLVTHHQRRSKMQQMYINELIKDMLEEEEQNWDDLQRIASGVNWNLKLIRGLLLLEAATIENQDMLRSVDHIFIQNGICRQFGLLKGQLVIFIDGDTDGPGTAVLLREKLLKYHQVLRSEDVVVSVSNPVDRIENIPDAYRITRNTLSLGRRFLPDRYIYECKNLAFLPYLYESAMNGKYKKIAEDVLAPLSDYDLKYNHELMRTFEALLMHDQSLQQVADSLFVHRNTLQYRKNKIIELLKEDPFSGLNRMNYLLALFIRKF
jgi:PucR family transcriptional regulator, purine catabolism regulatory protein